MFKGFRETRMTTWTRFTWKNFRYTTDSMCTMNLIR